MNSERFEKYRRNIFESGARNAHSIVSCHVRHGLLPKPSEFKCADCDKQAEAYDHRDYNKPLDVEPVCRRCNSLRGKAIPSVIKYSVPPTKKYLRVTEVIGFFGSREQAAIKIGVCTVSIRNWIHYLPTDRAEQVERLSGGILKPKLEPYDL